jgi:hypothetical protein
MDHVDPEELNVTSKFSSSAAWSPRNTLKNMIPMPETTGCSAAVIVVGDWLPTI